MVNKMIYQGRAYKAPNGQWSWAIAQDGTDIVNGAGYESEADALEDMYNELAVYTDRALIAVAGVPKERDPSYRSRPADDGGRYYLLPDDEHLLQEFEQKMYGKNKLQ